MTEENELQILRRQLAEALATLEAIRCGAVDAVVVELGDAEHVYSLQSVDLPYREFLEQMAEGALSLDDGHTILYCNRFFCDLVDGARQELLGRSFLRWLDSASRRAFEAAVASGNTGSVAAVLVRPDGEPVPVRLALTQTGPNRRRRTNVVVSDQRIRHEVQHLTEARNVAEAASSAKDRFLAVLSHELRNPLAALTSSVALLGNESLGDGERRWVHDSMARQLVQLQSLVNDLLDLTRVAQGKIALKREHVSLATVVDHALQSVKGQIAERRHTLSLSPIPDGLLVRADRMRLEQVLVNLLSNAVKYTPPGGAIAVTVAEEGDAVVVAVCDTGIGLEQEQLQQIFEPFVQLGEEGGGGLGIGLTLVKQLIDLHGGSVGVESPGRDRGSTFRIVLPRADGTEETAEAGFEAEPSMETGLRVLIVDDNADSADMLGLLLRLRGLDVATVHSGRAVEAAVARHRPELVLLDLGLPDLSGYDVARLLRDAGHERMVIVALTGFSHDDARERVRRAGFDAHVVKPISLAQVGALMEEFQDRLC